MNTSTVTYWEDLNGRVACSAHFGYAATYELSQHPSARRLATGLTCWHRTKSRVCETCTRQITETDANNLVGLLRGKKLSDRKLAESLGLSEPAAQRLCWSLRTALGVPANETLREFVRRVPVAPLTSIEI